ncbi:unnamed protein product, partial [Ixodes pacificus]
FRRERENVSFPPEWRCTSALQYPELPEGGQRDGTGRRGSTPALRLAPRGQLLSGRRGRGQPRPGLERAAVQERRAPLPSVLLQ